MYGTWCKAQFIPEKLTVKMGNNGRQQSVFWAIALGADDDAMIGSTAESDL